MADYKRARQHMRDIGVDPNRWNNTVLVGEALTRGIEVVKGPHPRRIVLRFNGKEHFWQQGYTSLNSLLARRCVHLKDVSSRLLRYRGAESPENALFKSSSPERAWAWAEEIAPVVVKPLDGRQGKDIYTNVNNSKALARVFNDLAPRYPELLVEEFKKGSDYRVFVVEGRFVAATHRVAAHVIGDGESAIGELIDQRNSNRPKLHKKVKIDDASKYYLNEQGVSIGDVPAEGRIIVLRGAANRSAGGDVVDATDDLAPDEKRLAEVASKAIPGLASAGLDILLPRKAGDDAACIIEMNSSPNVSPHHFPSKGRARDAAGAVVDAMFPETASPGE